MADDNSKFSYGPWRDHSAGRIRTRRDRKSGEVVEELDMGPMEGGDGRRLVAVFVPAKDGKPDKPN